ncbi:MAG: NAD(P)-dependent alcohol dehydrogenase [Burkholderiaceae bacterium]|nr:NAD(P)-dependent alcohol dehydrogenase [Burkholderiaceae bacterium]
MKTYRLEKTGSMDNLSLNQEADPTPGAHDVVIRVRANALNYRDLMVMGGSYRVPPKPRVIPLSDGAGEIVAVGSAVKRLKIGDRVAGAFFQGWMGGHIAAEHLSTDMGGSIDGMLSEFVVLNEQGVVKIPEHLSFEEAATLPCAAVTAWCCLTDQRQLLPGDTVLTLGSGGVSVFAMQFARMFGARVIATTSSDTKADKLRVLGAHEVINYTTHPEWDKEVMRLTGRRGADFVVEVGGPGTLASSLKSSAIGGHVVQVGILGGVGQQLDPALFRGRSITTRSITVGSRQSFEAMLRAIDVNQMRPVIDKVFKFEDAKLAYQHLQEQKHFGKVVISNP